MTYKGHVKNGLVVLDEPASLREGERVSVRPLRRRRRPEPQDEQAPTLYDELKPVIGKAKGLPADAARNHDHYLYGMPRR
ncbi:MAG TPA: hypothetical protein PLE19_22070 [Planctomycetota bacterium]|nr:hypothetical protein [Planctomycetota bacterium]HRR82369.1 hypothetical protein [Planctomycetota bacterium]HRT95603.1 hypothetical protein [Planctomycetota bacterium]